jgi:hypothetical protein
VVDGVKSHKMLVVSQTPVGDTHQSLGFRPPIFGVLHQTHQPQDDRTELFPDEGCLLKWRRILDLPDTALVNDRPLIDFADDGVEKGPRRIDLQGARLQQALEFLGCMGVPLGSCIEIEDPRL